MDEEVEILPVEEKEEVIHKLKDFIQNRHGYFAKDKTDFERSQNLQAGNGWFHRLNKSFGEARANLTINPLKQMVDSTMNAFIRNPYKFEGLEENTQNEINECLQECLRDACDDGLGYFYVYHTEDGQLKFKKLHNQKVIYSENEAIVIDKKRTPDGEKAVDRTTFWGGNMDILSLDPNEIPVLTYMVKDNGVVKIYKFESEDLTAMTELAIDKLPIITIKNQCIMMSHEPHYRGFYYAWQDAVAFLNACLTVAAEITIARTPCALAEESLAGNEEYIKQWESNDRRNLYIYKGFMQTKDAAGAIINTQLPAPTWAPNTQDLQQLHNGIQSTKAFIDQGMGTNLLAESKGNETATAVLLRKENKQASMSEMLSNLNKSVREIVNLIEQYVMLLTGQQIQINIKDTYSQSVINQNALDLLLTMHQSQVPLMTQLAVLQCYSAPEEIIQAVQLQIQNEQDPEKMEMEAKIQELTAQLQMEQVRAKEAEALVKQAEISAAQRYSTKEMEIQSKERLTLAELRVEQMKIELEYAKLGIEKQQKQIELENNDENEKLKIAADVAKDMTPTESEHTVN